MASLRVGSVPEVRSSPYAGEHRGAAAPPVAPEHRQQQPFSVAGEDVEREEEDEEHEELPRSYTGRGAGDGGGGGGGGGVTSHSRVMDDEELLRALELAGGDLSSLFGQVGFAERLRATQEAWTQEEEALAAESAAEAAAEAAAAAARREGWHVGGGGVSFDDNDDDDGEEADGGYRRANRRPTLEELEAELSGLTQEALAAAAAARIVGGYARAQAQ